MFSAKSTIILIILLLSSFACTISSDHPPETPTSSPALANVEVPADWLTYTDPLYGYSVRYPTEWELHYEDSEKTKMFAPKDCVGLCPLTWYISIIPEDMLINDASVYNYLPPSTYNAVLAASVGTEMKIEVVADLPELEPFNTFTRLPDVTVDQETGLVIENDTVWEGTPDSKNRRVLVMRNGLMFMLGTYYETQAELDDFHRFVASFQFNGE